MCAESHIELIKERRKGSLEIIKNRLIEWCVSEKFMSELIVRWITCTVNEIKIKETWKLSKVD